MNQPLISIIVPIYKVEKYLNKCIDSIINQTYKNLEIILVDDGSPDNCPTICDYWSKKDNRIVVIHKENGGLSDARNIGLKISNGDYIGFVDSDDWVDFNMYNELLKQITENEADIATCGVKMIWDNLNKTEILTSKGNYILNCEQAMKELITERLLKEPVWNKLYRKEIIKDVFFPINKTHEDLFWSFQVIGNAKKIVVIDNNYYFYRQRSDSIMGDEFSLKRLDSLEAKLIRLKYVKNKFPELMFIAKKDLFFSCVYHQQMSLLYLKKIEKKEAANRIRKIKKQYSFSIFEIMSLSLKERLWLLLLNINFVLICKLRNTLGIGF